MERQNFGFSINRISIIIKEDNPLQQLMAQLMKKEATSKILNVEAQYGQNMAATSSHPF